MQSRSLFMSLTVTALLLHSADGISAAANLDDVQFIKISSQESRAVIKKADGTLRVIKPGDVVLENITVKELAVNRAILEENTAKGIEIIIVRINNNTTTYERIRKQPDLPQSLVAPLVPPLPKQ